MAVFLNSFVPLCATKKGKQSATKHDIAPFVDGSCRREPDFEKEKPSITGLCRTDKLIPRLSEGDLVIYFTNKRKYYSSLPERRFIAILEVEHIFSSHKNAIDWYVSNNHAISQNIISHKTSPLRAELTRQNSQFKLEDGSPDIEKWDQAYQFRSRKYPMVAQCKIWKNHLELNAPRKITDQQMEMVFNRIPGTQTPPKLSDEEWRRFQEIIL